MLAKFLKKTFDFIGNSQNHRSLVKNKTDFTRTYKLTFESVVIKVLHSFNDSVDFNLSTFFPKIKIPKITAAAFSIARYKLSIDTFFELNNKMYDFIDTLPVTLWKGYRLIAGDGSTVQVPVSKDTLSHFGLYKNSPTGGKTVMANACMLYDVLSELVLSSIIAPGAKDEKSLMIDLLDNIKSSRTITIFDRGFSYFYFIKLLQNKRVDFCVRLKSRGLSIAKKILENPLDDFILEWIPTEVEKKTAREKGVDVEPIKIRATKIVLESGEIEVLVSTLFDMEAITSGDLNELYNLRWNIEEAYKKLKPKMKLEQFGCKKSDGIYQEFYSHIFMLNLTTLFGTIAQEDIYGKTKHRKYRYKYNWTNAHKFLKLSLHLLNQNRNIKRIIEAIIQQIKESIVAIVPGRSFNRSGGGGSNKNRFNQIYK